MILNIYIIRKYGSIFHIFIAPIWYFKKGAIFFKMYQNFVVVSFFLFFLFNLFLSCKDTFMNDYDKIYICNSLKYNFFEIFDNVLFIILFENQNTKLKKTTIKTKHLSSCVIHLKKISPKKFIYMNYKSICYTSKFPWNFWEFSSSDFYNQFPPNLTRT
jgi:hypothetical protein